MQEPCASNRWDMYSNGYANWVTNCLYWIFVGVGKWLASAMCTELVTDVRWYFCILLNLIDKLSFKKCIKTATVIFLKGGKPDYGLI